MSSALADVIDVNDEREAYGLVQRMLSEYGSMADAFKAKALAGQEKYYYIFFLGTRADARGRGLFSAIVRRYQEIASREELPILLEAMTESCMRLHLKLGWEVVEEMIIGKGKASADGMPFKGGEGVRIWGMIWRPRKLK